MSAKTTLITGFPHNLLAKHVVRRLLKDLENLQLRCVVQKPHLEFAASLIAQWSCENRVQLLEGETSAMDFGLSGSEYNELIREVEVLHHCDSTENNELDPKTIESINIGGVREALEFCESAKNLAHLIHWSTTLVSGTRKGYVSEDELETPPGFHDRIEESRFHAEKILRESMDRYPITILKPSRLMGDSTTGEIDCFSGPYLLVLLMLNAPPDLRLPMPGRGEIRMNMVPIDWVVHAGMTIARNPRSVGRIFHLVDPEPLSTREVFELIAREIGRPLPRSFVPTDLATTILKAPGLARLTRAPRVFLEQLSSEVVYGNTNTMELLGDTGPHCPSFSSYVGAMVEYVRFKRSAPQETQHAHESFQALDPLS